MNTKERIIQEAVRLFNERGVNQVGVRDIARALRISPGNLSYHFPKKEDLLVEILQRIKVENDRCYEAYFSGAPSSLRFLETLEQVFHNQYQYRGIYLAQEELRRLITHFFDYRSVEQRRKEFLHSIFSGLQEAGDLREGEEPLEFLVAFMSLLGRFWMQEAFLSREVRTEEETIRYYLNLVARQLSLLATSAGRRRLAVYL